MLHNLVWNIPRGGDGQSHSDKEEHQCRSAENYPTHSTDCRVALKEIAEQFMDDAEADSGTEGQSYRVHLEIHWTKIGYKLRYRKQQNTLQNLKSRVNKEHRELAMQPASEHGKHNDPLESVGSDPQVIPKHA